MTGGEWIERAARRLKQAGCPDPEADARFLVLETLGISVSGLGRAVPEGMAAELEARLARREQREPLQYILGTVPFLNLTIRCDSRALIPRPETEYMTDMALSLTPKAGFDALDLCCGTGAIGLSVKKARPLCRMTLSDISPDALALAGENAKENGLIVRLVQGDLFGGLPGETFDFILCNPPYLTGEDMTKLQAEVAREPEGALFGGADGLDFYRRLARELPERLRNGGYAFFEVGMGQARVVAAMMERAGETKIIEDYSHIERIVMVHRTV